MVYKSLLSDLLGALLNIFQSGFVFGIVHLSGFISASLMSVFGERFSVRTMSFLGAFLQGLAVFGFGMLEFVENVDLFLSLSYLLRLVKKIANIFKMIHVNYI